MEKPVLKQSSFDEKLSTIREKLGKVELSDEDLLLLAADSIRHTYTFEEKGYK